MQTLKLKEPFSGILAKDLKGGEVAVILSGASRDKVGKLVVKDSKRDYLQLLGEDDGWTGIPITMRVAPLEAGQEIVIS